MPDAPPQQKDDKGRKKDEKAVDPDADLSEEDLELKANLQMLVERLGDPDTGLQAGALEAIAKEIRSATTSMTSVPKPLKFLRAHYEGLLERHRGYPDDAANTKALADIISVLAMTSGAEGSRDTLKYRLMGTSEPVGTWGHEYVRHLAGEIGSEFKERAEKDAATDDLISLVSQIIPYHMTHNAEPEAVDLLVEVGALASLPSPPPLPPPPADTRAPCARPVLPNEDFQTCLSPSCVTPRGLSRLHLPLLLLSWNSLGLESVNYKHTLRSFRGRQVAIGCVWAPLNAPCAGGSTFGTRRGGMLLVSTVVSGTFARRSVCC